MGTVSLSDVVGDARSKLTGPRIGLHRGHLTITMWPTTSPLLPRRRSELLDVTGLSIACLVGRARTPGLVTGAHGLVIKG